MPGQDGVVGDGHRHDVPSAGSRGVSRQGPAGADILRFAAGDRAVHAVGDQLAVVEQVDADGGRGASVRRLDGQRMHVGRVQPQVVELQRPVAADPGRKDHHPHPVRVRRRGRLEAMVDPCRSDAAQEIGMGRQHRYAHGRAGEELQLQPLHRRRPVGVRPEPRGEPVGAARDGRRFLPHAALAARAGPGAPDRALPRLRVAAPAHAQGRTPGLAVRVRLTGDPVESVVRGRALQFETRVSSSRARPRTTRCIGSPASPTRTAKRGARPCA